MSAITPFLFDGADIVRTVERNGDPWFVAVDVCRILEIEKHRDAIAKLDADERGSVKVDTLGGAQEMAAVSESGLYTLILRSRKAVTPGTVQHRFRKWITAEVLPTIRKTGVYGARRSPGVNLAGQRQALSLIDRLKRETSPTIRRTLHGMLAEILGTMGMEVPVLADIGRECPPPPDLLVVFWREVAEIEATGIALNHSRDSSVFAIRLLDLRGRVTLRLDTTLHRALRADPRFIASRAVNSFLTGRTVKCWVFDWRDAVP